ncbi:MAG: glycosyltransferase [Cystobacterineae bacterium]|nr:glycosyltransferase [Cystobacterineae bacterium]
MKILLLCCDLFKTIGGGQSVYRRVIENTPEAEFYYFRHQESAKSPRPANAHALQLPSFSWVLYEKSEPFRPLHWRNALHTAAVFASAVAGQSFDIIESPDYETFGACLKQVFAHYRVGWGRVVLSMHGNISTSLKLNWRPTETRHLEDMEARQFREADGVYSLSRAYMKEWQNRWNREVEYVNPLHFVFRPAGPLPYADDKKGRPPDLCCVGRLEKLKGNDIFQELARWLPDELYDRLLHIGAEEWVPPFGGPASQILAEQARRRSLCRSEYLGAMNMAQMAELYGGKTLMILPTRYDTLNLVALEALFHGCPTAISSRAGVCQFLDEEWPGLPYVKIDMGNIYGCLGELRRILSNYEDYRAELSAYLLAHPVNMPPLNMAAIYQKFLDSPAVGDAMPLPSLTRHLPPKAALRRLAPAIVKKAIKKTGQWTLSTLKWHGLLNAVSRRRAQLVRAYFKPTKISQYTNLPEDSAKNLENKLRHLYSLAEATPLSRVLFWRELARLEDLRQNHLFSATYKLRVLRAMGDNRFSLLESCAASLEHLGFPETASAARALYAPPVEGVANAVYDFLEKARERHLVKPEKPYEVLEGARCSGFSPLVSVIVSTYRAEAKLEFFLTALAEQTLVRAGRVELIIQDSASPQNERGVLQRFLAANPSFKVVYGRSPTRETIQEAWNRGIRLARAPYLVFLGVDEGLYPEALELMVDELEKDSSVDWVMANSVVMETDEHGTLNKDVMSYNRQGGTKDHVYLETCYLGWVGGIYRRNIHERFGYYDESFRGAGDTEFKNRVLPKLKVKFLPKTLGLFFNYPEERTTASPMAEIEDTRAWYIHRSLGGARYAFEQRSVDELREQFWRALSYRKSYCGHISTDFDYALALALHGQEREGDAFWAPMVADLTRLRDILTTMELYSPGRISFRKQAKFLNETKKLQKRHATLLASQETLNYRLFNDNRYEQHSWLWKSVK